MTQTYKVAGYTLTIHQAKVMLVEVRYRYALPYDCGGQSRCDLERLKALEAFLEENHELTPCEPSLPPRTPERRR